MSARAVTISTTTVTAAKTRTARPLSFRAGSLVGVLDNPARTPAVLVDLKAVGIEPEPIEVVREIDGSVAGRGPVSELASWVSRLGPERALSDRYLREVMAGHVLLVIRDLDSSLQATAGAILRASGGRCIHQYGRFTIRTIAP